jgi:uncharacterized OB-fold protein
VTEVTQRAFFAAAREGRLIGIRCVACGALAVPPKAFCERCGKQSWETVPLAGKGTIESFTVIRVAPRKFVGEVPYAIAAVRLAEGVSLLGRIVDAPVDEIAVGLAVRFSPIAAADRTALAFRIDDVGRPDTTR